jgi:hypothetical protein
MERYGNGKSVDWWRSAAHVQVAVVLTEPLGRDYSSVEVR